jgi:hypothetical protein
MRRHLVAAALGGALTLALSACGSDAQNTADVDVCNQYNNLISRWSTDYGNEMGAVGQADAAGDEQRRETAVPVVRGLYETMASDMRAQAARATNEELADALNDAADGLDEIAGEIETYEDVEAAPDMMSEGTFADAGQRVSEICAG